MCLVIIEMDVVRSCCERIVGFGDVSRTHAPSARAVQPVRGATSDTRTPGELTRRERRVARGTRIGAGATCYLARRPATRVISTSGCLCYWWLNAIIRRPCVQSIIGVIK